VRATDRLHVRPVIDVAQARSWKVSEKNILDERCPPGSGQVQENDSRPRMLSNSQRLKAYSDSVQHDNAWAKETLDHAEFAE